MSNASSLHVLHTEFIHVRGGEKYLYEVLRRVAVHVKTTVYVYRINSYWKTKFNRSGIRVIPLWSPHRGYWILLPITIAANYFQIKKFIRKIDTVFATNFPTNFMAILLTPNNICHCFEPLAIFYDIIRINSLPLYSKMWVWVARLLYSWLDKWAYSKTKILTSLGPSVEAHIINTYQRKPDIYLPNGVDTAFFTPSKTKKQCRTITIGHSTDYTVFKGTADFLSIMKELSAHRISFKALISESIKSAQTQKMYASFIKRNGLENRVRFVGSLSELELRNFYRSLDVFVYTGSPECAGGSTASLSVLEAQSCGIPVIKSLGDYNEILPHKTGIYINPHHHKDAALTLYNFFTKQNNASFHRNARKHIVRSFSWKNASNTLLSLITNNI